MKKIDCFVCAKQKWFCTKHPRQKGKIHSGIGASVDCFWNCPRCEGKGYIELSIIDRFLIYIAKRTKRLLYKVGE